MAKKYWLFKSEPNAYSIYDMEKDKTTFWDGVRNYQARNFIRDDMKKGDQVLFYHSNAKPNAVAGICEIIKEGYPDFTAFDPDNKHFDPKSKTDEPAWFMVDIKFIKKFKNAVTLEEIKNNTKLKNTRLVQRGNRLSVFPIKKAEFDEIVKMSK
ncbi:MAG: EVE domain-containing protein [Ignavibacteriae bacterium]|nr:EVE domain-containing protein [Ignavibacteriota bacterium]NOG99031.1 EVE domain-containing protein [Ignavibacteriota bacterium]